MPGDLGAGERKFDTCIVCEVCSQGFSRLNLWYFTASSSPRFLVSRWFPGVAFRAAVWGRRSWWEEILVWLLLGWFLLRMAMRWRKCGFNLCCRLFECFSAPFSSALRIAALPRLSYSAPFLFDRSRGDHRCEGSKSPIDTGAWRILRGMCCLHFKFLGSFCVYVWGNLVVCVCLEKA